jgi:hypothetical protein
MFRFTIREVLFIVVIIGLSLAWWLSHRRLASENTELRLTNAKLLLEFTAARAFPEEESRIREIRDSARQSPPSREIVDEVLFAVRYSPDFRIRVRAMAVLPHIREKQEAIDALIAILRDRSSARSADGVVPLYATKYLAELKATCAIGDIEAWLKFVENDSTYDAESKSHFIATGGQYLSMLNMAIEPSRE